MQHVHAQHCLSGPSKCALRFMLLYFSQLCLHFFLLFYTSQCIFNGIDNQYPTCEGLECADTAGTGMHHRLMVVHEHMACVRSIGLACMGTRVDLVTTVRRGASSGPAVRTERVVPQTPALQFPPRVFNTPRRFLFFLYISNDTVDYIYLMNLINCLLAELF